MTSFMQAYKAPTFVTVPVPTLKSELQCRLLNSECLSIQAQALLVHTNLYGFSAQMRRIEETWYFLNRANIGETGARPSPKYTALVLEEISTLVNESLKSNEQFKADLESLQQDEQIRADRQAHDRLKSEYRSLQNQVHQYLMDVGQRRVYLEHSEQAYAAKVQELETFKDEHPEVLDQI